MNLDDLGAFREIDTQNLIGQINSLPDQISSAYEFGQEYPLPKIEGVRQVVLCGMGASIIYADLLAAYAAPLFPLPLMILRDYNLPAWCRGPETFIIASSHSGNTEETLSAFSQAVERGCRAATTRAVRWPKGHVLQEVRLGFIPILRYPGSMLVLLSGCCTRSSSGWDGCQIPKTKCRICSMPCAIPR